MGFGLFIFLIFWSGVTVGNQACQPDDPPPEPIEIKAPALEHP